MPETMRKTIKNVGESLIRHLRECGPCAHARSHALRNGGAEALCTTGTELQAEWVRVSSRKR